MEVGLRRIRKGIRDANESNYSSEGVDRIRSAVMSYIHGYYEEAFDRVPPSLIPRIKKIGFCFGFLDPVSNIIANTVAFEGLIKEQGERGEKRKRSWTGTSSKEKMKSTGDIEARSLRGLVAFLTSYFRYLPDEEALRYLRLSKADLLVAVRLIEEDRDTDAFTIRLLATKGAMTCAVLSAMRPIDTMDLSEKDSNTMLIVDGCLTLSSRLDVVAPLMATQGRLSSSILNSLTEISKQGMHGTADPREPMLHAISRSPPSTKKMLIPHELELSLKTVLLDRIHGFYLKAISSIPAPCLLSLHHRGLLKAGHCYGPFDPVANIILNSIWYDTVLPPQQKFEVNMIRDESLAITECRSLHGLLRFLTTLFPALSTYNATRYLLIDNARLDRVIFRAMQDGYQRSIPLADAYMAAASAAYHPNSTALANLATVLLPEKEEKLKSLLEAKRVLSAYDIQTISTIFSPNDPLSKSLERDQVVSAKMKKFMAHQSFIRRRVEAVLKKHAQDEGEDYELLVICGVNPEVAMGDDFEHFADGYQYSHMNIWARLKGSQLAGAAPVLLFIECSNDSKKEDFQLCLPVSESSKDSGRCFHCECVGAKVVHPTSESYRGQTVEFEDMARGDQSMSNGELLRQGGLKTVFVDTSADDCIYFCRARGADFAQHLNKPAKRHKDYSSAWKEANMISAMLQEMVASVE